MKLKWENMKLAWGVCLMHGSYYFYSYYFPNISSNGVHIADT